MSHAIAVVGASDKVWELSRSFRVPTRNGRFRYFPTEDKAREFAEVIGANEIEFATPDDLAKEDTGEA